jgi:copper transport protein
MGKVLRTLTAALVVIAAVIGLAGAASAHATLESSDPAPLAVLAQPPSRILLTFDEQVEVGLGGISLYDSRGGQVDIGKAAHPGGNARQVEASVPELADGSYVVAWRVVSADSHPVHGAYTFQVGTGAAADTSALLGGLLRGEQVSTTVGALLAISRFAGFLALAVIIGGFVFLARWSWLGDDRRLRTLLLAAIALGVVAALAAVAFQGPYATGRSLADAVRVSLFRDVATTRFGEAMLLRAAVLAIVGVALVLLARHAGRWWWRAVAVVGLLVVLPAVSAAGHAGSGRLSGLGYVLDGIHVTAMGVWLGGLVVLTLVVLPLVRPRVAARSVGAAVAEWDVADEQDARRRGRQAVAVVHRFSTMAFIAVVAIVASGLAQAWRTVGSIYALFHTTYGALLMVKTAIVVVMVGVAAVSRRLLFGAREATRDLRRSVGAEVVLGLAVLAVTAILTGTSPAVTEAAKPYTANLVQGDTLASITVTPAHPGPNELHLLVQLPGGSLQKAQEASARFSLPSKNIGPIDVNLVDAGPNHWISSGLVLPFSGRWQLQVTIRTSDIDSNVFNTTVPVH